MNDTTVGLTQDLDRLMARYVALCNLILSENQHRFLFRQARRLGRAMWGKARFRTIVYDRDPAQPLGDYILRFDPDAHLDPEAEPLSILLPGDPLAGEVAMSWKVSVGYLNDVVTVRPEWYRRHPLMLDWNWITDRSRDEVRRRPVLSTAIVMAVGIIAGLASSRRGRRRRAGSDGGSVRT
jgi:hypothetical protein